jgi:hypothetical protein
LLDPEVADEIGFFCGGLVHEPDKFRNLTAKLPNIATTPPHLRLGIAEAVRMERIDVCGRC